MTTPSHGIDDIKDEHAMCRALAHAWDYSTARKIVTGFEQTLVCIRCGTEKTQYLNRYGEIETSRYHYSDGYVIPGLGYLDTRKRGAIRTRAMQNRIRRAT